MQQQGRKYGRKQNDVKSTRHRVNVLEEIKSEGRNERRRKEAQLACSYFAHCVALHHDKILRNRSTFSSVNNDNRVVQLQLQILEMVGVGGANQHGTEARHHEQKDVDMGQSVNFLDTRSPFRSTLQFIHDHREVALNRYLKSLIKKQRFEKQCSDFLNQVQTEYEETQKRVHLSLDQVYSKYLNVPVDNVPEVDTNLQSFLSMQFERLIPQVEGNLVLSEMQLQSSNYEDIYSEGSDSVLFNYLSTLFHTDRLPKAEQNVHHKLSSDENETVKAQLKHGDDPIEISDELRDEHKLLFFAILQYVTTQVVLPDLLDRTMRRYNLLRDHFHKELAVILATRDNKQKVQFLQLLFNISVPRPSNSLLRRITRITMVYYEEYCFQMREQHYYSLLTSIHDYNLQF